MPNAPTLVAAPITREAFARYGWLIDAAGLEGRAINAGSSQRIDGLTELVLASDGGVPCLAIFRAQARELAGPWQEMERHRLGTQTFVPLNGARYVVLVAGGGARPDPATLMAFLVGGHQGITLRPGTWHHALLALDGGDFVVLERRESRVDCETATLAQPLRIALG